MTYSLDLSPRLMNPKRRPMDHENYDERRDPNRQLFRDLHVAMEQLEEGLHRLLPLLEQVAVLKARVDTNAFEISRLRDRLDGNPLPSRSGIGLKALSLIVSVIGILVTVLLKLADWAVGTLHASPPK